MSIASLANYASAHKQWVRVLNAPTNINAAGTNGQQWVSTWIGQGGSANPGNNTTGIVPTNSTTGAPAVQTFSNTGYITAAEICTTTGGVMSSCWVLDRLFVAGQVLTGTTATLGSQPSYSGRLPGTDYHGLRIFIEAINGITLPASGATITYTNENGTTGRSATTAVLNNLNGTNTAALECPLASGDNGVQKIESITLASGNATAGINVIVARPLCRLGVGGIVSGYAWTRRLSIETTHMAQVYPTSCLYVLGQLPNAFGGGTNQSVTLDLEISAL